VGRTESICGINISGNFDGVVYNIVEPLSLLTEEYTRGNIQFITLK
jgi:hypothetical protein